MRQTSNVVPFKGTNRGNPNIENGKVPPLRRKNKDLRSREYLTAYNLFCLDLPIGRLGQSQQREKGAPRDAPLIFHVDNSNASLSSLVRTCASIVTFALAWRTTPDHTLSRQSHSPEAGFLASGVQRVFLMSALGRKQTLIIDRP